MKKLLIALVCILCSINFYAQETPTETKAKTTKPATLTGLASYYSANLDGSPTSSGERFSQAKLTCASNHVKLGTWLKVTNIKNGKSVFVKVNDRMHPRMAKKGRIVDLTITAFSKIGNLSTGILKVKVENYGKTKPKGA
jgi:rare lipoprotein A